MDFDAYQEAASTTAMYPGDKALEYLTLGLCSESGEVAGKMKKIIRDKDSIMDDSDALAVLDEAGDVLWYISQIATELGFSLSDIAERNIQKLSSRKARGAISGNGDNR